MSSSSFGCLEVVQPVFLSLPNSVIFGVDSGDIEGQQVEAEINVSSTGSVELLKIISSSEGKVPIGKLEKIIKKAKFIPAKGRSHGGEWRDINIKITHTFEF